MTAAEAQAAVDRICGQVIARFGHDGLDRSAIAASGTSHAVRVLRQLSELKPSVAIEIGTHFGVMSCLLSLVCKTVLTLDIWYHATVREILRINDAGNVVPIIVGDDAAKAHLLNAVSFDFAFVDGDHTAEGVARDFALVRRCGRLLFHDYRASCPGVDRFLDSMTEGTLVAQPPFAWWFADGALAQRTKEIA